MLDIIQFLIKRKFIDKEEAQALKDEAMKSGKAIDEVFAVKNPAREAEFFRLKSEALGIPLRKDLPEEIPHSVLSIIPRESADFYKIIPIAIQDSDNILEVGMIYPESGQAQEALKFLVRQQKLNPQVSLITFSDFKKYFGKYQAVEKEVKQALESLDKDALLGDKSDLKVSRTDFERLVEEAPTIKIVSVILRQAIEGKASDIHIEPAKESLRVRYRMDGILYSSLLLPLQIHPAVVGRIKILSRLKIDETRLPQDGRFSAKVDNKLIDFRVSTLPTSEGEKVVLRVLDSGGKVNNLADLGLVCRDLAIVQRAIELPYKMILVTGPTGSGKTTTLYAMMNKVNNDTVNIITLEDPIEYFMPGVNQSQVNPDIGYTFASGLRQILRQDPDIIMVGEIRDDETANLAVHAALTGHLVFSTLHTNSAVGVVPRLLDMGVKPFLIPPTISTALSQRLVRVLCPFCKKKIELSGEAKKYVLSVVENFPETAENKPEIKEPLIVFAPVGCKKCNKTGYSGRIGAFETLEINDAIADLIVNKAGSKEIFQEARKQGMTTMEEDGILKVLNGITSLEEIMQISED